MAASTTLTAYPRTVIGKANRRLAHDNRIPAVLYGPERETVSLSVDKHEFEQLMAHHAAGSTILELEIEGEKKPVNAMIREMQTSPVKGNIVHVDFLAVQMDKLVHAVVTLRFINDPVGVKAGGVLTTSFHEINVEAKPGDLPPAIEVDVSALEVGDSLHVSDVVAPQGVAILDDPGEVLVSVQAPRLEVEEEVEVAEEEEAEPEVIGGKAEEE
jgi:large subunit ribosomal protein L25